MRTVTVTLLLLLFLLVPSAQAQVFSGQPCPSLSCSFYNPQYVTASPALVIADAHAATTTMVFPSATSREAHILWKMGTVAGTFTTCTAQLKTSFDGSTWLTLGSAAAVTATSGTVNMWSVWGQTGTTSVTVSSVSSTAALSFGRMSRLDWACSGAYGTSAPASVSIVLK